jgi:hypothetical protein
LAEGQNATSSEHPVPHDGGRHAPDAELAFGKPREHSLTFQQITIGRYAMSAVKRSNDISASWRMPVRSGTSWLAVAVELPMFERTRASIRHACSHPLLALRSKPRRSLEELFPCERPIRRHASGSRPRARVVWSAFASEVGKRTAASDSAQSPSGVRMIDQRCLFQHWTVGDVFHLSSDDQQYSNNRTKRVRD